MNTKNLKVKDVMTRGVVTVPINMSVKEIAKIITEAHVHGVCVTNETGEVAGVISDMDIIKAVNKDLNKVTAEDIMTDKVVTISGESCIEEAVEVMTKQKIHRLIVVLESADKDIALSLPKRPVGILSASDIVRIMSKD